MTDLSKMTDDELLSLYSRPDAASIMPALIAQESSGRLGVLGPPTQYGRAEGMTQMLPATAQATAAKLGLPWRPELMRAATPEAADYQRTLGQGYLQEGLDQTGNVQDALRYYHGGPDRAQWGPKTEAYVQKVSARLGNQAPPANDLSSMSDADLLALYGQPQQVVAPPPAKPAPKAVAQLPLKAPKPAQAQPGGFAGGLAANLLRSGPLTDEMAGGARMVADIVTGKSKVNLPQLALGIGNSLPGGNVVEAGRAFNAAGIPQAFNRGMAAQRGVEDGFATAHPHIAALAKGVGGAASVALPAGPVATTMANGSRAMNAVRGATTAGLFGAGYAAMDRGSPAERLKAASETARNPIVLGLGAAAGAIAPAAAGRAKAPKVNLDELRAAKQAAYKAADDAGVQYTPEAFGGMVDDIVKGAAKDKLNPMRHPKAASMIEEMQALKGTAPTLTELDQLRQVIRRDVASAPDDAERFFGERMIKQIDGFIDSAGPQSVVTGSADNAATLIKNARAMNTRVRKVEAVTDAVESARLRASSTGSGGNVDNATRQNLRRVLENTRNLTPQERKAMESIVVGGKGQNALRLVGKLSPSGNGLMAAGNLAAAANFGGLGAIPGAAGIASKFAADRMTQGKVQDLIRLMASEQATPAQIAVAQQQLNQMIAANPTWFSAGSQGAARLARAAGAVGGTGR